MRRLAAALLFAGATARLAAQPDPLLAEVDAALKQARGEIEQFEKAGGSKSDARHPVAGWVEKLSGYRERDPRSAAAAKASAEAIHLLVHAERFADVEVRAERLSADDAAWESLPTYLAEAAALRKDYSPLIRRLESVLAGQPAPKARARLYYQLGLARAKLGETEPARTALQRAREEAKGTPLAKEAQIALFELDNLGYGQAAPSFSGKARDGSRVALEDFRGRVVLLVFWAST